MWPYLLKPPKRQHSSMVGEGMPPNDLLLIAAGECVASERRRALGLPVGSAASKNPTGRKVSEKEVRMNRAGPRASELSS